MSGIDCGKISLSMFSFQIKYIDRKTKARVGEFLTPHGILTTPNLAFVGTQGNIKLLNASEMNQSGMELMIVNTYHLWVNNKVEKIYKAGGIHSYCGFKGVIMSDSGGYQVFSLGFGKLHKVGKIAKIFPGKTQHTIDQDNLIQIRNNGVTFKTFSGENLFLNAQKSIELQEKIGADIIFTFDECTSPLSSKKYTSEALRRTHEWARICKAVHAKIDQALFGIVQGGAYKELRLKSVKTIKKIGFKGYGIGGSLGKTKKDMLNILDWVVPLLEENKPRHLLGIGEVMDLFNAIEKGVDLFDCVIPTREARHGVVYTHQGKYELRKVKTEKEILEKGCLCLACQNALTRDKLYSLYKSIDFQEKILAQKYLTLHNIYFFSTLLKKIRSAIAQNQFAKLKKYYSAFYQ